MLKIFVVNFFRNVSLKFSIQLWIPKVIKLLWSLLSFIGNPPLLDVLSTFIQGTGMTVRGSCIEVSLFLTDTVISVALTLLHSSFSESNWKCFFFIHFPEARFHFYSVLCDKISFFKCRTVHVGVIEPLKNIFTFNNFH